MIALVFEIHNLFRASGEIDHFTIDLKYAGLKKVTSIAQTKYWQYG